MKNLVKILGIIAIGVVMSFSMAGCDTGSDDGNGSGNSGGNNSGGNNSGGGGDNITITLESNAPYGWQKTYEPASLLNGTKISQGDDFTFTYSFKSNVAMDYLEVVLIDNCAATNYTWKELSGYVKVKDGITTNTVYSGSVTISATATATDATALANRLVFQAGTGTSSQPTLTFTALTLGKGTGGGNNNGGNNSGGNNSGGNNSGGNNNGGGNDILSTPTGVTATALSSNSISVTWNAVSGATSYRVNYKFLDVYSWDGPVTGTSYTHTGLSPSTTYSYSITAFNSEGLQSEPSDYASATTQSASSGGNNSGGNNSGGNNNGGTTVTKPSAPTGVSATAQSSSSISVSWSSVSGATSYDVYYEVGLSSTKNFAGNTSSTSYTHTGLQASTTYFYYIKAKNSAGESGYSSTDYATTQSASSGGNNNGGTTVTKPSTPTGVTALRSPPSDPEVIISWNAVSGATQYRIYQSMSASGTYKYLGNVSGTSTTQYFDTSSTTYWKISAWNSAGESSQSSYVSVPGNL